MVKKENSNILSKPPLLASKYLLCQFCHLFILLAFATDETKSAVKYRVKLPLRRRPAGHLWEFRKYVMGLST